MVAFLHRQRLILPIAPVAAGLVWVVLAAMFAAVSPATLDRWAEGSGLPTLLTVARPPLGFTARLVLILLGGGGAALATWLGLSFAIGQRAVLVRRKAEREAGLPMLRRKDAHPDAPPRAPMSASRELGTPFLDVIAPGADERAVPVDLDQPLAAFDPAAIPEVPMAPVPAVAPLAPQKPVEPPARIETFEMTPMVRPSRAAPATPPIVAEETRDSISALIDRLEYGMARREERNRAALA